MKTFIFDNTLEGFYSTIFTCYEKNEFYCNVTSSNFVQKNMFDNYIEVETNLEKANRVKNGLLKKVNENLVNEIATVFCSNSIKKDQILFEYVKLIFAYGFKARLMLNNEHVIAYNDLLKKVTYERHRMIGFMRFEETVDGVLYAKYSPDNNITHLLLGHFANRFSNENVIIHDTKRNVLGIYSKENSQFFTYTLSQELSQISLSEHEQFFQNLWQQYYKNVNIKERKNINQMFMHMPKRYHSNLNELKA